MPNKVFSKLNPSKEPVAYAFLALVAFQVFFKGEAVPENWLQYVAEFVAAAVVRQKVTPTPEVPPPNFE